AQRFRTKRSLVEIPVRSAVRPGVARILKYQTAEKIGLVNTGSAGKGAVAALRDGHRESRGEPRDSVQTPALGQPTGSAGEGAVERNFVIVTEDEILRDVELRQRPAL